VGLDNGNVAVYDIRRNNSKPIYQSSVKSKKHTDPVWAVKWNKDSQKLNFYSISSDGRVLNWLLMKDLLECEEVYKLKFVDKKNKNKENECSLTSLGCGLCFDFSKVDRFSFIVGTEEGNIHLCYTAYSGDY
jgi:dynein intermediate chain 1